MSKHPGCQGEILPAGQIGEEGGGFHHRADTGQRLGAFASQVMAGDSDLATMGPDQAEHAANGGGFAGAIGSQESIDTAFRNAQRDVAQRLHGAEAP